jgi:hypothetical protein
MAYFCFSLARSAGHGAADAAPRLVMSRLSAQDKAKADAILKPASKQAVSLPASAWR